MSSASSVGGAGQGLYQFLQKVSGSRGTQDADGPQGPGGPPPSGHAHGPGKGGKHGELFSKIESAVTDALNSSSDDSDPEQTVQDAIAKVLNGDTDSTTSTTSETSTDGTQQPTATNDQSSREAFFQTLKDHGVDPEQFRQDLMSAFKQARENGQLDRGQAFASVPAGVAVDLAA